VSVGGFFVTISGDRFNHVGKVWKIGKIRKIWKIWKMFRFSVICWFVFLILVNSILPIAGFAAAKEPNTKTFFEYEYKQSVDNTGGAYSGYSEETKGTGRYDVVSWGPDEAVMKVDFSWTYSNDEGDSDSGSSKGEFSFNLTSREYTSEFIDVDDFYHSPASDDTLYQWLWISPDVKKGDEIHILDSVGVVKDKDATVWSRFVPYKAIEVVISGSHSRDDDYGQFDYTFKDKLYFDKTTGLFFAERYVEYDEGSWEGEWAKFRYYIEIDVTRCSYDMEIDWYELIVTYFLIIFTIVSITFLISYGLYRARFMKREFNSDKIEDILPKKRFKMRLYLKLYRVWKPKDFPFRENRVTNHFGPFLEHWTKKALLAKDRVAVIVSEDYGLVGFALYNKEGKIGTILCRSTELTEYLRSFIRCKDFFSEKKHTMKDKKKSSSGSSYNIRDVIKDKASEKDAYNIFGTYNVYNLSGKRPMSYDTRLVRPMCSEDLRHVIKLAKKIYRTKAKRWISASYKTGELGMVAEIDGKIVGFGFAEVCGSFGRLHTLGVAEEYRGAGIGKELHRARLEAMRLLGVTTVVDEIADWNLASIRISTLSGFEKTGKMFVETIRRKRIKKNIVRR
jgi:L-amino acid N-acyltransferase YncA